MLVQIDSREKDRIKSATKYYTEDLKLDVSVEELPVGDYIFTDGNESVVFEFKLVSDFVASIQDGRVFNQAISQSEEFPYHFILIYGDQTTRHKCLAMTKHYRRVTIFQYIGAIASLNRYTTVIECSSPFINEVYYRMYTQAKKCLQQKPIVKKFPKKHKNPAFNYLAYCVYGVSSKRANDIVKELNLKTLEDLLYLDHNKLTSIDGIGPKLADKIIKTIQDETYES